MISTSQKKGRRSCMSGTANGREFTQSVSRTPSQSYNFFDAAVPLAESRANAEIAVCESLLADPIRAVPRVRSEGVRPAIFQQDDLRIIAAGCFVAEVHQTPREQMLALICRGLRAAGFWDDDALVAPPFGCRWSERNLRALASSEYFCRATIARNCQRLLSLDRREREARAYLIRAAALIRGAA